jgi:putative hydrolase of the HAD superfamily
MQYHTLFFDLDDTLYPAQSGLWEAIRDRMNKYMDNLLGMPRDQITALRQSYLETYGTTLRGLQHNYHVDADEYLAYVHDIPLDTYIQPDPTLRTLLLSLPQRRWIFTNSDINHSRRVMSILGVDDCFDGIIDIRALGFVCKPDPLAYHRALELAKVPGPKHSILFDDSPRNLAPAREMGFHTVLVGSQDGNPSIDKKLNSLHDLPHAMPELWL